MAFISYILINITICIVYISLYGFLRAFISIKLGDKGNQAKARKTLNPSVHIDPIGFLFMIFYGVGFIKPMINQSNNFKNRKGATILISTLPTIILFTLSTIAMWVYFYVTDIVETPIGLDLIICAGKIVPEAVTYAVMHTVKISLGTLLYNLIPIYPLEGERILNYTVSPNVRFTLMRYDKALQMLLIVLTMFGLLPNIINEISNYYISVFY